MLAYFAQPLSGVLDRIAHFWSIRLSNMAKVCGKVRRVQEYGAYALDRGNGFELMQCSARLYLNDDAYLASPTRQVARVLAEPFGLRCEIEAVESLCWLAGRFNCRACLMGVLHERNQQVLHTCIEQTLDPGRIVCGRSHKRGHGIRGARLQRGINVL